MDHTDDFSKNWRIQEDDYQPLNETNIDDFIATQGEQQAIGYMRAVQDFINELEFALADSRPDVGTGPRPSTRVRNNTHKLLLLKDKFFKTVSEKGTVPITRAPN